MTKPTLKVITTSPPTLKETLDQHEELTPRVRLILWDRGFTDKDIVMFESEQPEVQKILFNRLEALKGRQTVETARSISKLKGYRLERAMQFLAPLGRISTEALIRIMK